MPGFRRVFRGGDAFLNPSFQGGGLHVLAQNEADGNEVAIVKECNLPAGQIERPSVFKVRGMEMEMAFHWRECLSDGGSNTGAYRTGQLEIEIFFSG